MSSDPSPSGQNLSDQDLYNELAFYTLELRDPDFIHQHIVDAWAVQHAETDTKPIAIVFGLIGLYLYVEKNFSGRQVQLAHMRMARYRRQWVAPPIPERRAVIGVANVLAAPPGSERHAMIRRWCEAVWQDWHASRPQIVALAHQELGIAP
ncbi:MAG TPA: DUF5946 family protein [Terracidiphilus sp.]|jgi:hypothetical protein|nr:DUF5946 family protein [Terracidiphilus sp.]